MAPDEAIARRHSLLLPERHRSLQRIGRERSRITRYLQRQLRDSSRNHSECKFTTTLVGTHPRFQWSNGLSSVWRGSAQQHFSGLAHPTFQFPGMRGIAVPLGCGPAATRRRRSRPQAMWRCADPSMRRLISRSVRLDPSQCKTAERRASTVTCIV
jgi:hypothetical protein